MPKSKAVTRLKKWNPLKLFKGKVLKEDNIHTKAAYTSYKRGKTKSPETVLNTMSYSDWRKSRKKTARPE